MGKLKLPLVPALFFCIFAYLRSANQQCLNKAFRLGTSAVPGRIVKVVSTVYHRVLRLVFFLPVLRRVKRTDLREQDVSDNSYAPHIRSTGERLKLYLFRGTVLGRSSYSASFFLVLQNFRHAEIAKIDFSFFVDQDVFWLEI